MGLNPVRHASATTRRPAATLVELLVVIAIIGLLAGLVLGGVLATRDAVRHTVHLNWLRQRRLDAPPLRQSLRVLFIGNSHTYVNDIPGVVASFAREIGCQIEATTVAVGGQTLEGHWEGPDARPAIESDWWDFVVLQEQSTRPVIEVVRAVKDVELCPVGEAWRRVREERPELGLFMDGNHASEAGGYLTACVFHAVLHRTSPVGLPHEVTTEKGTRVAVDPATAGYLQGTAWTVAETFRRRLLPPILQRR